MAIWHSNSYILYLDPNVYTPPRSIYYVFGITYIILMSLFFKIVVALS